MNVPVVMPQLGLTMTEGTVSEWLRKPGDLVRKGDLLFVVSTDKADMEVESLAEGTLAQIVIERGRTVPVGTVIAYLEKPGGEAVAGPAPVEDAASPNPTQPAQQVAREQVSAARSESPAVVVDRSRERPAASPRARRLARELGVDISTVQGSGAGGRIVEDDVRKSAGTARSEAAAPT